MMPFNWKFWEKKDLSFIRGVDDAPFAVRLGPDVTFPGYQYREVVRNSIVAACASWASRNINQTQLCVFDEDGTGNRVPNYDHPLSKLIAAPQKAVPYDERAICSSRVLWDSTVWWSMIIGEAYWHKLRGANNMVVGLEFVRSTAVRPVAMSGDANIISHYEVTTKASTVRVPRSDMVHFTPFGLDPDNPIRGRNPLIPLMWQVKTDNQIGQYQNAVLKSPNPRLAVVPDGETYPTVEQAAKLQEDISRALGGDHSGRAMVPTFKARITPFSFSPDQMATTILSKLPEERVCAVYGIPPEVLRIGAGLGSSTYNNMKEAREAATEEFLVPLWESLAETVKDAFEFDKMVMDGEVVGFDLSKVRALQDDVDASHKRAREDFAANITNRAEARLALGLDPMQGDEAVWAYTLRPAMAMPGLPQGPQDAQNTRKIAEGL